MEDVVNSTGYLVYIICLILPTTKEDQLQFLVSETFYYKLITYVFWLNNSSIIFLDSQTIFNDKYPKSKGRFKMTLDWKKKTHQ